MPIRIINGKSCIKKPPNSVTCLSGYIREDKYVFGPTIVLKIMKPPNTTYTVVDRRVKQLNFNVKILIASFL